MVLTCVPISVSGEDMPVTENWPIFRPGIANDGVEPDMAVDGDGGVHLAYVYNLTVPIGGGPPLHILRHSFFSDGEWTTVDLGEERYIHRTEIVLDGGEPHIFCMQDGPYATVDLVHWRVVNGTWTYETIWNFGTVGDTDLNAAVDGDGIMHLVLSATLDIDFTFKTHLYLSNSGGDWSCKPLITVRSSYGTWYNPPQISLDVLGRPHIAYLNITDHEIDDWYSGNYTIHLTTLVDGEWVNNRSISVGTNCNRFSLGLDERGYESILFQRTEGVTDAVGPVSLYWWSDAGWCTMPYENYGTSECQLVMDDGQELIMMMDAGGTLHLIERSGNDRVERTLGIPHGMRLPKEFAAGTWGQLRLLYYDEMAAGVAVAMPSQNPAPTIAHMDLDQEGAEVQVEWDEADVQGGPSVVDYVLYRTEGRMFNVGADTAFLDSTSCENPRAGPSLCYRLSVLNAEGEEYVISAESLYFDPEEAYEDIGLKWVIRAAMSVFVVMISITAIVMLMKRERLSR
jgi:hypothetical protein